jgi:methylenetetrahydrofolate reductase (NADPH)
MPDSCADNGVSGGRPNARARLAELLRAASVEIYAHKDTGETLSGFFQTGADVYISYLPGDDYRKRVAVAASVRRAGFNPVMHVPARQMTSRDCLDDFLGLSRQEAAVERVLLIAGDSARPRGPFKSSLDIILSGLLQRHGIGHIDVAGHPEGHSSVANDQLGQILRAKRDAAREAGLGFAIVSQFCFDPRPIADWLRELHGNGFEVPIRIGLAGPANPMTLLKFALRCGVGNSLAALQKHASTVGHLLRDTGPEGVVRGLGPVLLEPAGRYVERFHFFPFGGVAKTSAWLRQNLALLDADDRPNSKTI